MKLINKQEESNLNLRKLLIVLLGILFLLIGLIIPLVRAEENEITGALNIDANGEMRISGVLNVESTEASNFLVLILFAGLVLVSYIFIFNFNELVFWIIILLATMSLYIYFPSNIIYIGLAGLVIIGIVVARVYSGLMSLTFGAKE